MSTFSGLSTALSSLTAQRQAIEVVGQNIANAGTPGYTRQRADLTSVGGQSVAALFAGTPTVGNGVRVTGVARMGDVFLDARVRAETSSASFGRAQATTLARLEATVAEPGATGVSAALQGYWAAWQDVSNRPDDLAARTMLLGQAEAVVHHVASGHRAVETQWTQVRTELGTLTTEVNSTARAVADLNAQIRSITASGGSANELVDRRDRLVTGLSELVGADARLRADGTLDVMVGGNMLVRGEQANTVRVDGAHTMDAVMADGGDGATRVRLVWVAHGTEVALDGGRLASHVLDLAPSGALGSAARAWDGIATSLATTVDGLHRTGVDLTGTTGRDFFRFDPGPPAPSPAVGLRVAITDPAHVAAGAPGKGAYDGSLADALSQGGTAADGPDRRWQSFVVDLGVRTRAADERAGVAEAGRATAEGLQLSAVSVDLDEETVNLLAIQRAYEGAARVLTAIDEMLDVLINRTGTVGR